MTSEPTSPRAPRNRFLERVARGERATGTFVFSPDPAHTEIAGAAGLDLVVVDLEHAALDIGDVLAHVRAADSAGISCWARLGHPDPRWVGRLLDAGAQGVVLPHFGLHPEATRDALAAFRYAPHGSRGTCTGVRAVRYGVDGFADYAARSDRDSLAVGLVEDATVIDDIERVLAELPVDAVMPGGPGDLATSLGLHGQGTHPKVIEYSRRVIDAARAIPGMKVGVYVTDAASAAAWSDVPLDFVVCSIDYRVLARAFQDIDRGLRGAPARIPSHT
jgi:2-keto-3-deoxy-L-rhamnonate aldolase RhmA